MAADFNRKLVQAAHKGLMDTEAGVKQLTGDIIKTGADLEWSEKPFFRTAFFEGVSLNHEPVVKYLMEKGANINCVDYNERTPLHEACWYGYKKIVELLLEAKAEIKQDKSGQTPLFLAIENRRDECAKILLEKGCDPNITDVNGLTAGHIAAFKGLGTQAWWLFCKGAWKNRFAMEDTRQEIVPAPSNAGAAPPAEKKDGDAPPPASEEPAAPAAA